MQLSKIFFYQATPEFQQVLILHFLRNGPSNDQESASELLTVTSFLKKAKPQTPLRNSAVSRLVEIF